MPNQSPIIMGKLFADLKQTNANEPVEDVKIWNAFRERNETAFVFIYETHFDRFFAYGLRIAGDGCLVNRTRIGETDSIKFYLFKCLKRKLQREASKWLYKRQDFEAHHYLDFTFSHNNIL